MVVVVVVMLEVVALLLFLLWLLLMAVAVLLLLLLSLLSMRTMLTLLAVVPSPRSSLLSASSPSCFRRPRHPRLLLRPPSPSPSSLLLLLLLRWQRRSRLVRGSRRIGPGSAIANITISVVVQKQETSTARVHNLSKTKRIGVGGR